MKKTLFFLAIFSTTITCAQDVLVITINNNEYAGTMSSASANHISFLVVDAFNKTQITYRPSEVKYVLVYASEKGKENYYYVPCDSNFYRMNYHEYKAFKKGVFTPSNESMLPVDKSEIIINKEISEQELAEMQRETDLRTRPNYVIGRAFQSTGTYVLSVGIPCFIAGITLIAYGYSNLNEVTYNKARTKSQAATAGIVLTSTGSALTIVGIPLVIHGKNMMTINFNYTGNGIGVAAQF